MQMEANIAYKIAGAYKSILSACPSMPEFRDAIRNPDIAVAARLLGKTYSEAAAEYGNNRQNLDAEIHASLNEMGVDPSGAGMLLQQAFEMHSKKSIQRKIKSKQIMRAFKDRMMSKPDLSHALAGNNPHAHHEDIFNGYASNEDEANEGNAPEMIAAEELSPEEALREFQSAMLDVYEKHGGLPGNMMTPKRGYNPAVSGGLESGVKVSSAVFQLPSDEELMPIPDTGAELDKIGQEYGLAETEQKYESGKKSRQIAEISKRTKLKKEDDRRDNGNHQSPASRRIRHPNKMGILKKAFLAWSIANTLWIGAAAAHFYVPETRKYLGSETLGIAGKGIEETAGLLERILGNK